MIGHKSLALGLILAVGAGAASAQQPTPNDMLLATLWTQRAVEYKGNAMTVYALAKVRLDQALAVAGAEAVERNGEVVNANE